MSYYDEKHNLTTEEAHRLFNHYQAETDVLVMSIGPDAHFYCGPITLSHYMPSGCLASVICGDGTEIPAEKLFEFTELVLWWNSD